MGHFTLDQFTGLRRSALVDRSRARQTSPNRSTLVEFAGSARYPDPNLARRLPLRRSIEPARWIADERVVKCSLV